MFKTLLSMFFWMPEATPEKKPQSQRRKIIASGQAAYLKDVMDLHVGDQLLSNQRVTEISRFRTLGHSWIFTGKNQYVQLDNKDKIWVIDEETINNLLPS